MKPIDFKESNITYAKDQKPYLPLPAYKNHHDPTGEAASCWKLSFLERIKILFTGKLWIKLLTFHEPLQPISCDINKPNFKEDFKG